MQKSGLPWAIAVILALFFALSPAYAEGDPAPGEMTGKIKVGDKAPDFTLKDQNGVEHTLSKMIPENGKAALVYYRSADW